MQQAHWHCWLRGFEKHLQFAAKLVLGQAMLVPDGVAAEVWVAQVFDSMPVSIDQVSAQG